MTLSDEFGQACREAVEECRLLGYIPTVWISMMNQAGATEAAKRLLVNGDIQSGFERLIKIGRRDLTVEHAVLEERWEELFDERHREAARWRLAQAQSI